MCPSVFLPGFKPPIYALIHFVLYCQVRGEDRWNPPIRAVRTIHSESGKYGSMNGETGVGGEPLGRLSPSSDDGKGHSNTNGGNHDSSNEQLSSARTNEAPRNPHGKGV